MRSYNNAELCLAICDDEQWDRDFIHEMVCQILEQEQISTEVTCYASGTELLRDIQAGKFYHILLLDVMMEDMDGIALASALRAQDEKAEKTTIVFISSSLEMALRGYEVAAVRYLVKPVEEEKLREALRFCGSFHQKEKALLLQTPKGQTKIEPSSILYVESQGRGVVLTLTNGQTLANIKISDLFAMLPKTQYVFCHRTVLVNLAYVDHIRQDEIELKNGQCLPISRHRLAEVRAQFLHYLDVEPR